MRLIWRLVKRSLKILQTKILSWIVKIPLEILQTKILGGNAQVYNMLCRPSEHVEFSRLHHRDDRLHRHLLVNDAGLYKWEKFPQLKGSFWCQDFQTFWLSLTNTWPPPSWRVSMQRLCVPSGSSDHSDLSLGCPACRFFETKISHGKKQSIS